MILFVLPFSAGCDLPMFAGFFINCLFCLIAPVYTGKQIRSSAAFHGELLWAKFSPKEHCGMKYLNSFKRCEARAEVKFKWGFMGFHTRGTFTCHHDSTDNLDCMWHIAHVMPVKESGHVRSCDNAQNAWRTRSTVTQHLMAIEWSFMPAWPEGRVSRLSKEETRPTWVPGATGKSSIIHRLWRTMLTPLCEREVLHS